MKQVKEV